MSEKLKPCPFCGATPQLFAIGKLVCCESLTCSGNQFPMLIRQWETRPIEDALKAELKIEKQNIEIVARLIDKLNALKADNTNMSERLEEWREQYATITSEKCPPDEQHCTCVPVLREEIQKLNKCIHNEAVMTNEMQSKYIEQVHKNELLMDEIEKIKNKSYLPGYD